jgi:predicted nuclease with TOPRIM domain
MTFRRTTTMSKTKRIKQTRNRIKHLEQQGNDLRAHLNTLTEELYRLKQRVNVYLDQVVVCPEETTEAESGPEGFNRKQFEREMQDAHHEEFNIRKDK